MLEAGGFLFVDPVGGHVDEFDVLFQAEHVAGVLQVHFPRAGFEHGVERDDRGVFVLGLVPEEKVVAGDRVQVNRDPLYGVRKGVFHGQLAVVEHGQHPVEFRVGVGSTAHVPSPHVVILLVKVTELVDDGAVVGERVAGGGVQGELNERRDYPR